MRVTVKLFATLTRFRTGVKAGSPFELDLSESASAKDVIALLQIPTEEIQIVFINNIIQDPATKLKSDDVVGIFPPVGGG